MDQMSDAPQQPEQRRGPGRPKKPVDWKIFEAFCKLQATQEEICDALSISHEALNQKIAEHYGDADDGKPYNFLKIHKEIGAEGLISLRRAQFQNAIDRKSAVMQIWLGKQYLNQTDRNDLTSGGGKITGIQIVVEDEQTKTDLQAAIGAISNKNNQDVPASNP